MVIGYVNASKCLQLFCAQAMTNNPRRGNSFANSSVVVYLCSYKRKLAQIKRDRVNSLFPKGRKYTVPYQSG